MKRWVWFIILIASCRSGITTEQPVRVNKTTYEREVKFKPEAEAAWKEHQARVLAEIAKLGDHLWAGTYYFGDGKGKNVTIDLAPRSGFAYQWVGCIGVYDRNYGEVKDTNRGSLELHPVWPNDSRRMGVSEELEVVLLGERRYLVPPNELFDFRNAIAANREPRSSMHGYYLLRKGDHEKTAEGIPQVSGANQWCLLEKPVIAEVISIEGHRIVRRMGDLLTSETKVKLDVGRNHGVLPGFVFTTLDEGGESQHLCCFEVIEVDEIRCTAIIRYTGSAEDVLSRSLLGHKVTTGA